MLSLSLDLKGSSKIANKKLTCGALSPSLKAHIGLFWVLYELFIIGIEVSHHPLYKPSPYRGIPFLEYY